MEEAQVPEVRTIVAMEGQDPRHVQEHEEQEVLPQVLAVRVWEHQA